MQGTAPAEQFDERQSWQALRVPSSPAELQAAIAQFKQQLAQLQACAGQALGEPPALLARAALLQEAALHLAFHLGEVVLMRRLQGNYPLPAHMQTFLRA